MTATPHFATIFDMDGVLVDSFRPHFLSWQQLAGEHGLEMTAEQFRETFGRTSREIIRHFWGADTEKQRISALDARKEALYRQIVSLDFPAMDGARELVVALAGHGTPLAVGSSGPPENVALALERLGVRHAFGAVVTGRDVRRGKPDPEVFELCAERLGVPPARCVVIEDAPAGIEAARRAGMAAVAFASTGRRPEDFHDPAPDLLVTSLRELSPAGLAALVERCSGNA